MDNLKQQAIDLALQKMWKGGHFSICTIDSIANSLGVACRNHPDYKTLHLLHCVDFNQMSPEMLRALPGMISNVLNVPDLGFVQQTKPVEVLAITAAIEHQTQKRRKRLFSWKE